MLQDDVHITIHEIQRLQNKGRDMTLAEKDQLDEYYSILPKACGIYDTKTKTIKPFTTEQYLFVRYIIATYIQKHIPKLEEVMALYDLPLHTIFVWEDTNSNYGLDVWHASNYHY